MHRKQHGIILQLLKHSAVVGFSFVIVWGYVQIALNLSFLNPVSEAIENFSITDKYYQMMPERENHSVVIVDLSNLYYRGDIARTLEEIEACHPSVIGMDCVFEGEKEDPLADNALRDVAARHDNIVFSYRLLDEQDGSTGYGRAVRSFFADEQKVHEGVTNMQRENIYDGIKRVLRLGWTVNGRKCLSFVGEILNLYAKTPVVSADDEDVKINFAPTNFTVINPSEIAGNRDQIAGKIVLFGTMSDELDMHYTPLGKMAGVLLLAYATQTLLEDAQIVQPPAWVLLVVSYLLLLLTNAMQLAYLRWTNGSHNPLVFHVLGTAYVQGLVTFLWIAVVIWVTFLCFCLYNVNVDIEWPVAAMAFLSTARSTYAACEDYYNMWKNRKKLSL